MWTCQERPSTMELFISLLFLINLQFFFSNFETRQHCGRRSSSSRHHRMLHWQSLHTCASGGGHRYLLVDDSSLHDTYKICHKDTRQCWMKRLMNMFGGLGTGGLGFPNRLNVPPKGQYATELSQLREMHFFDAHENLWALIATNGNVHTAVE